MSTEPKLAITSLELEVFTAQELAAFLCCQVLSRCGLKSTPIHHKQIAYMMGTTKTKEVKNIMDELYESGYLGKKNNMYTMEYQGYKFDGDRFTLINVSEFEKIMFSNRKNRFALLRHLIYIIRSFDYRDCAMIDDRRSVVGHMTVDFFVQTEDVHANTVLNMNKALEELELIYIHHGCMNMDKYMWAPNCYGRWADRVLIDRYAKSTFYTDDNNSKTANKRRSLSQRYNHYVKTKGAGYNMEETEKLKREVNKYNNDMANLTKFMGDDEYINRSKDMSVFSDNEELFG